MAFLTSILSELAFGDCFFAVIFEGKGIKLIAPNSVDTPERIGYVEAWNMEDSPTLLRQRTHPSFGGVAKNLFGYAFHFAESLGHSPKKMR